MSVEIVTAWLLPLLDSHYGGFCFPVAWSRYLLPGPAVETQLESFSFSVLVYVAAAAANKVSQYEGGHASFAPLIATEGWTYLYPLFRQLLFADHRKIVERIFFGAVALMAAALIAVALTAALYFYTSDTLCFVTALALGRCTLALVDEWVIPSPSFLTHGGIFVAAVAVAIAGRSYLSTAAAHLFPYNELVVAFGAIEAVTQGGSFEGQIDFRRAALKLLILTIHIQISMGFVNIKYLRKAQDRMNALLSVEPLSANKMQSTCLEVISATVDGTNDINEVTNRLILDEEPLGFTMAVDSTRGCLRVESVQENICGPSLGVEVGDILVELNGNRIDPAFIASKIKSYPRPITLGFSRPSRDHSVIRPFTKDSPPSGSPSNTSKAIWQRQLSGRSYARHAVIFVVKCALPYLGTRAILTSCQTAATSRFQACAQADFLVRLFKNDEPISGARCELNSDFTLQDSAVVSIPFSGTNRLRALSQSEFTVTAFSDAVASTFGRSFGLIQGKISSLPNLALFNELLLTRPTYVGVIIPLSVLLDHAKGKITGAMTARVHFLQRQVAALQSKQLRMYEHDLRYEERNNLAAAGGASSTRQRWVALSREVSALNAEASMVEQFRQYVEWLYWSDILKVSIEVLLAILVERGTMNLGEVWVNSRVLEDAMDMLMSRSRLEADLSYIATDVDKLTTLTTAWNSISDGAVLRNSSLSQEVEISVVSNVGNDTD